MSEPEAFTPSDEITFNPWLTTQGLNTLFSEYKVPVTLPPFELLMRQEVFIKSKPHVMLLEIEGAQYRGRSYGTADIKAGIERGVMPSLAHGWSFVLDRRPEGEEHAHIPSGEYTAYFANRQIPIADTDHDDFMHDVGHVPSYQRLFGIKGFGDLVHLAATNAVDDPELCKKFTGAIDGLGDTVRNFESTPLHVNRPSANEISSVIGRSSALRRELMELVDLRNIRGELLNAHDRSRIIQAVFNSFNVDAIERAYGTTRY